MPLSVKGYVRLPANTNLTAIQQIFVDTFGTKFNLIPTGSNGLIIQILTNAAVSVSASEALLYSGIYNPDVATDIWLDSICAWSGIKRKPATSSVVTVNITGTSGVVIQPNSNIINTNGDMFYNQTPIVITNGTATGTFYSVEMGPIQCNAGTVTGIVQAIPGWDTVTNPTDGIVGQLKQSNTSLRETRKYSLGVNSTGGYRSVKAACNQNVNILNNYLINNNSSNTITDPSGTISINPNSIYLSVYFNYSNPILKAQIEQQIAAILYAKLSGGCGMTKDPNTGVLVSYEDPDPQVQDVIFPAIFNEAVGTPIYITVNMAQNNTTSYPANATTQIQDAIIANFNGQGEADAVDMGDVIYAGRFYQPISLLGFYQIVSITIGTSVSPTGNIITLPINQMPILNQSLVTNIVVNFVKGSVGKLKKGVL
jgi:hypothetical protein